MPVSPDWSSTSTDPNSPAALDAIDAAIRSARRPRIDSRLEHLRSLATGRRVLDIGVVEHRAESRRSGQWLHRHLVDVAATCVGVDILDEQVAELRAEGFDVRLHDVTAAPLDEEFDLIVAGEVIEHLGHPQALLANCAAMLAPGGRLVVTTPNPYMLNRAWRGVRGHQRDSADHVALFTPANLLELARRSGLSLSEWRAVRLKRLKTPRGRIVGGLRRLLCRTLLSEEADSDTLVFEFTRRN